MNLHYDHEAFSELIIAASNELHIPPGIIEKDYYVTFVANLKETRSRRSYNCYRASYSSIYSPLLELKPELVIETYIALLPFPTVNRMTDNYIYLKKAESPLKSRLSAISPTFPR